MYSKRVTTGLKDEIDVDWQLIAADIDTSVHLLRYLHKDEEYDCLKCEQFDWLINEIENVNGSECVSYNDYMVLYEYMNEPVIIYTLNNDKYVIFEISAAKMIEAKMSSYIPNV